MELKPSRSYSLSNINYTTGQKEAIDKVLEWSKNNDYTPFTLSGFAGTGKTTIAKDIVRNLSGTIAVTAPTHKAVRVASNSIGVEGSTIQKLLGLRPNTDLETFDINKPQFDPLGNNYIKNYKYVLVDECSMINSGLFAMLTKEAIDYKVKLIFIGDPYQLPPVKESYSKAFYVKNTYNLTQIVRQENDNALIKLLNIARDDVKNNSSKLIQYISKKQSNFNNETDAGFIITDSNHFADLINDRFSSSSFENNIDYCRYTAFTNRSVSSINSYVRHLLFGFQNEVVIHDDLFTSYSTILNDFNQPIIINSEDYIVHEILNYNNQYLIKGYLVKLRKINGGDITDDMFILDHTNSDNLVRYLDVFNKLLRATNTKNITNRRNAWSKFYEFKNYNLLLTDIYNDGRLVASKDLDYGFGLTVHKTQGSTFDNIFVNAKDIIYNQSGIPYSNINLRNRLLYVALSRAKNGAFILI